MLMSSVCQKHGSVLKHVQNRQRFDLVSCSNIQCIKCEKAFGVMTSSATTHITLHTNSKMLMNNIFNCRQVL